VVDTAPGSLSLYRSSYLSDGVRLEVEPQWRIHRRGSFSDYGEELPWGPEDDAPEVWQPYQPYQYSIEDEPGREQFRSFVRTVMRLSRRAHERLGDRVRTAAKRFLTASFHLAPHGGWKHGEQDRNEEILFNLVRAADSLFFGRLKGNGSLQETFIGRVMAASGRGKAAPFLNRAYDARSRIAHGDADPPEIDLSVLQEIVRFAFIGFLGMSEGQKSIRTIHAQLDSGDEAPQRMRELRHQAVAGSRDPRRRRRRP
jgi:hypothetical protein